MTELEAQGRSISDSLYRLQLVHRNTTTPIYKAHGLAPQQAALLWQMLPGQAVPMGSVAERLGCDVATVTGIVDRLEARGLIERTPGKDRRVKLLSFTAEGLALRKRLVAALVKPPLWIEQIEPEEVAELARLLARAVAAAESDAEQRAA